MTVSVIYIYNSHTLYIISCFWWWIGCWSPSSTTEDLEEMKTCVRLPLRAQWADNICVTHSGPNQLNHQHDNGLINLMKALWLIIGISAYFWGMNKRVEAVNFAIATSLSRRTVAVRQCDRFSFGVRLNSQTETPVCLVFRLQWNNMCSHLPCTHLSAQISSSHKHCCLFFFLLLCQTKQISVYFCCCFSFVDFRKPESVCRRKRETRLFWLQWP